MEHERIIAQSYGEGGQSEAGETVRTLIQGHLKATDLPMDWAQSAPTAVPGSITAFRYLVLHFSAG